MKDAQNSFKKAFDNRENIAHIHKVYNSWVKALETSINYEISLLHTEQYSNIARSSSKTQTNHSRPPVDSSNSSDRALKRKSSCNNTMRPSITMSEQAYINSSRANLVTKYEGH